MRQFKSLTIEITGGDDALTQDPAEELMRLLRIASKRIEDVLGQAMAEGDADFNLYDLNGRPVGQLEIETEEVAPDGWLCEECLPCVTDGDLTQVDMNEEPEATRLAKLIERGAAELGEVRVDTDVCVDSVETCECCGRRSWGTYTGFYKE